MRFGLLFITCLLISNLQAQDTLPKFSAVKLKDGNAYISWINDYGIVKQITIQRSTDSMRRYASIGSDSTPMDRKGVFIDKKAKLIDFYYRIYVQLPEGKYFYTPAKKVRRENGNVLPTDILKVDKNEAIRYKKKIDSLLKLGYDTATIYKMDSTLIVKPKVFQPSDYIFTDKKGNVLVALPNAETRNYSIIFYDDREKKIMQIKRVQESNLIIERYNFYKSGWYLFEIKEGTNVIEKHKFFLPPLVLPPANGKLK